MRLLLDSCLPGRLARELRALGHDVDWVGEWISDPGDEQIQSRAAEDGRILVTLDKDFGELAILRGQAHRGIVRLISFHPRDYARVIGDLLIRFGPELQAGAIATAAPGRVRIRRVR